MRDRLASDRPVLLVEVNRLALNLAGSSPKELTAFLAELGYRISHIGPRGRLIPYDIARADDLEDVNILAQPISA